MAVGTRKSSAASWRRFQEDYPDSIGRRRQATPHLRPGAFDHTLPGRWTPHVTLARGVTSDNIGSVLGVVSGLPPLAAQVTALRRWDGDQRVEFALAGRAC